MPDGRARAVRPDNRDRCPTLSSSTELAIHMSARPTWAEVNLNALQQNYRAVQQLVSTNSTICCVVKCDAYGHGSVECARALQEIGATWFGVTSTEEAVKLRRNGITTRIMVMTGFWRGEEDEIIDSDLTPAVWSIEHLQSLQRAAERHPKRPVPVHVKVDTGMSRLGLPMAELPAFLEELKKAEDIVVEGENSATSLRRRISTPKTLSGKSCASKMCSRPSLLRELRQPTSTSQTVLPSSDGARRGIR